MTSSDSQSDSASASAGRSPALAADEFELFDLRVEVIRSDRPMVCNHAEGDSFTLRGENLSFPPGQSFPLYPLAALLPLLPAKQRETAAADWMTTDTDIACPDPLCGGLFRITRTGRSRFRHGEVTRMPLEGSASSVEESLG